MKKILQKKNKKSGYAIIELLFYISLFALLSLLVINALLSMTSAFKETAIQSEILNNTGILERISREIRQAESINSISATSLSLNTKDTLGNAQVITIALSGANVTLTDDGVLVGNLNTPQIQASSLSFTEITTTSGKAVKVFITISSLQDSNNRSYDFYNTVVLRGAY